MVERPHGLSSAELVNFVLEKASVDSTELLWKGAVKVNLRDLETSDELVFQLMCQKNSESRSLTEEVSFVLKAHQLQQEQIVQQNQLMASLIS